MKKLEIKNHNLVSLLRTFSARELRKLSGYLSSPYFACTPSVELLYKHLMKFHPKYSSRSCTGEALYQKIFPGRKFTASTFRDLMSSLLSAAVQFITLEASVNDPSNYAATARELRKRGLKKLGLKKIKQAESVIAIEDNAIDSDFFMLKYRLEIERLNYCITFNRIASANAILQQAENLKKSNINIMLYAVMEIITNYIGLVIYSEKFGAVFPENYLKTALKDYSFESLVSLAAGKSKYDFILELYSAMLKAFSNRGSIAAYNSYKNLVGIHISRLSKDEAGISLLTAYKLLHPGS